MDRHYFIFAIILLLTGCQEKTYENQDRYEIQPGESISIYYSTNSCCYYCLLDGSHLQHLELVEEKTIDPGPRGCDGCNFVAAYIFKATSVGVDTVLLNHATANEDCHNVDSPPEKYIVEVKRL